VDPIFYESSYTTDASYADRLVAASYRYRLRGRRVLVQLGFFAVLATVMAALTPVSELSWRIVLGAAVFVWLVIVVAAATALGFLTSRRSMRKLVPAGRTYSVTLRQNALGVRDWMIASENSYALWSSADIVGDHLILQRANGSSFTPLSRQLFTPEAEAWVRARIANQQAQSR